MGNDKSIKGISVDFCGFVLSLPGRLFTSNTQKGIEHLLDEYMVHRMLHLKSPSSGGEDDSVAFGDESSMDELTLGTVVTNLSTEEVSSNSKPGLPASSLTQMTETIQNEFGISGMSFEAIGSAMVTDSWSVVDGTT